MKRRRDGRTEAQLRPMLAEFGLLAACDGSARLTAGDTKVIVGIQGPRPPRSIRLEHADKALLEIQIVPATGLAGPREAALEAMLRGVFEPVIVLAAHPRTVITIAAQVANDDGSLAAALVNCTSLALADAGVPMRGLAAGACVAAGAATDTGASPSATAALPSAATTAPLPSSLLLDPSALEDASGTVSAFAAFLSTEGGGPAVLHQDGALPPAVAASALDRLQAAASTVFSFQRLALRRKLDRDAIALAPSCGSAGGGGTVAAGGSGASTAAASKSGAVAAGTGSGGKRKA